MHPSNGFGGLCLGAHGPGCKFAQAPEGIRGDWRGTSHENPQPKALWGKVLIPDQAPLYAAVPYPTLGPMDPAAKSPRLLSAAGVMGEGTGSFLAGQPRGSYTADASVSRRRKSDLTCSPSRAAALSCDGSAYAMSDRVSRSDLRNARPQSCCWHTSSTGTPIHNSDHPQVSSAI